MSRSPCIGSMTISEEPDLETNLLFLGLLVVGARGFEPPTPGPQTGALTGLRYAPILAI